MLACLAERVRQLLVLAHGGGKLPLRFEQTLLEHVTFDLTPFEVSAGKEGSGGGLTFAAFPGSLPSAAHVDESRFLHGLLGELEAISDLDTLLARLSPARAEVMAYVGPLGP